MTGPAALAAKAMGYSDETAERIFSMAAAPGLIAGGIAGGVAGAVPGALVGGAGAISEWSTSKWRCCGKTQRAVARRVFPRADFSAARYERYRFRNKFQCSLSSEIEGTLYLRHTETASHVFQCSLSSEIEGT